MCLIQQGHCKLTLLSDDRGHSRSAESGCAVTPCCNLTLACLSLSALHLGDCALIDTIARTLLHSFQYIARSPLSSVLFLSVSARSPSTFRRSASRLCRAAVITHSLHMCYDYSCELTNRMHDNHEDDRQFVSRSDRGLIPLRSLPKHRRPPRM